jgi:carbamoyltransferase
MIQPWLLGLGGSDHDFSAALMHGCDIRVAIEQERLSRRKHSPAYWYENPVGRSIDYCLLAEGIALQDVNAIVGCDTLPARIRHDLRDHNVRLYPHHLCHAASAYLMLPPGTRAGVLVYDGYGSIVNAETNDQLRNTRETISFYRFGPEGYKCLGTTGGLALIEQDDFQIGVSNSIGMLYEMVTGLIGYDPMDSGKTMGLSSYGTDRYVATIEEFIEYGPSTSDCLRIRTEDCALSNALERALRSRTDSFAVRADIAASIQTVLNKTLLHSANFFEEENIETLCISGGCGLNTVANTYLVQHSPLSVPIVIPPHCNDAGLAFGALWLEQYRRLGRAPETTFRAGPVSPRIARPGRNYSAIERRQAVQQFYPRLVLDASVTTATDVAKLIAEGSIVALFEGGSEFGPRALGGRSILADPRSVSTRERINRDIKRREPFRPLAPIVRRADYDRYFSDYRCADSFMLKTAQANEHCARVAPAIVHVDGSARIQVVSEEGQPFLAELLNAFEVLTGVGILINTSFNRRGEPIVETPGDAIDALLGLGLDGLFMDGEYYRTAE